MTLTAAPSFITDPPALRNARRKAAEARHAYHRAKSEHRASEALRRAWVLAKARLAAMEARHG